MDKCKHLHLVTHDSNYTKTGLCLSAYKADQTLDISKTADCASLRK